MASVVFKVKYEDTLRRFYVAVKDGQRLDLSMEGLRLKICSLFNMPPETDFRLTYNDEDDDLVTLGEDEDLHDVVRQGLNPVRITVHLKSVKSAQNGIGASGSSIPSLPSSQDVPLNVSPNVVEVSKSVQEPLSHLLQQLGSSSRNVRQNSNPDVAEIVKAVQEPISHALSKLSLEMSSKAASVSPVLADLVDSLSKMGHSYLNASQSESVAANLSRHVEVVDDSKPNSEGRPVEGMKNNGINKPHPSKPANSTPATEGAVPVPPQLWSSFSNDIGKNERSASLTDKMTPSCDTKKNKFDVEEHRFTGNMARLYHDPIPPVDCPFSGIAMSGYGQRFSPDQPFRHSSSRSFNKADGFGSIFHKGVRCDGCGVLPITGPRFKSKVKNDFDLCSFCFSRMGSDADYTRIDFPLPYRHSWSFKTTEPVVCLPAVSGPSMAQPRGAKQYRSKPDSRFIMDINVVDGTSMPPSTPFTKIWRMRNNGTLPWSSGLQLLWIGGDRFSPSDSVVIEVPLNGVPVGSELDIAVDFTAPELPGRYISYWRMAEPSGYKFGQRVWVLIQVDAGMDVTHESTQTFNLNLPPDDIDQATNLKAELELFLEAEDNCGPTVVNNNKIPTGHLTFPTNDDLLFNSNLAYPSTAAVSPLAPSSSCAAIPISLVWTPVPNPDCEDVSYNKPTSTLEASFPIVNTLGEFSGTSTGTKDDEINMKACLTVPDHLSEKNEVEENLLIELEEMGFKQIDLNKEVLKMNKYDLELSVDELCSVSEWDPILEELKEMGFEDKETNKKLLEKNNGSITRVVMDLIAEEKA